LNEIDLLPAEPALELFLSRDRRRYFAVLLQEHQALESVLPGEPRQGASAVLPDPPPGSLVTPM
ncbi:MAG TPA: hypothetical protein VMD31_04395, partial [Opitutaceae bacterium]|nr:hypothetical protein [Opitutaceae bacterium]